jgi:tetratricopeptide (TPR) repeat protein
VIARLRRLLLALAWLAVIVVMALGGAGVVAQWSHPPGTPARAELTWHGDQAVGPALDTAQADLRAIGDQVDHLSVLARGALAALTADDQEQFAAALGEGGDTARAIAAASTALRADLVALPGDLPTDQISYGSDVRARRAAMLDALDSTSGLARSWASLTIGSLAASDLISLLTSHDVTVAAAASQGRDAEYPAALSTLAEAVTKLDDAADIRNRLENTTDVDTLDQWISRNRRYDEALIALYTALRDSGGLVNDAVRDAFREEGAARAILPPDTRGLVVIVAEIGRGGLNQAVIAIEQARGRLTMALEALTPAGGGTS